jgi:hypothetical protein
LGKRFASDKQEETEKYSNCNWHRILDVYNVKFNTEQSGVLVDYRASGIKFGFHENRIAQSRCARKSAAINQARRFLVFLGSFDSVRA